MAVVKYSSVKRPQKPAPKTSRWPLYAGVAAIVILIGGWLTWHNHFWTKHQTTIPATNPLTNQPQPNSSQNQTTNSTNSQSSNSTSAGDKTNTPTAGGNQPLLEPYGTFVSNHHPSLANGSAEQSVCLTTPGATCAITFTNGAEVKKLETRTTDSNGSAYWNWDVKTAGFSQGSWTITVTAAQGSNTKTATDSLKLEVQP